FGIATGAYAEFAAAKQSKLEQKPGNLSHEAAAVATISGITALQALVDVGGVEPEQSVLVIGASGGVGTYTVQLAKALGASVSGVSSSAKTDLVRSLGADHVIDYGTDDYLDGSTRYDLIVDIGGRNPVRHLRKALTKHGSLVIVGGEGGGSLTGGIGRQLWAKLLSCFVSQRLTFFVSGESQVHIERLTHFLASGDVVPMIGHRFRLDEVGQALRDMEAGRTRGKSVIVLDERGRS
ncbi:MAG: NAD(P)-dependent alcohol dehydrogenase, partial [Acidimicrobiia bacterium]|nr:NAD(P)-dependent alcohol dehydrogenase [Acidimicrobiia bacterium]